MEDPQHTDGGEGGEWGGGVAGEVGAQPPLPPERTVGHRSSLYKTPRRLIRGWNRQDRGGGGGVGETSLKRDFSFEFACRD